MMSAISSGSQTELSGYRSGNETKLSGCVSQLMKHYRDVGNTTLSSPKHPLGKGKVNDIRL